MAGPILHRSLPILLGLLFLGCENDPTSPSTKSSPVDAGVELAISDGRHGGNSHFYFLPPLVRSPHPEGTFDPTLSPIVKVCQLPACAGDLASFTRGSGRENVAVDQGEEAYRVNWHTKMATLASGDRLRIRVFVGTLLLGFLDVEVVAKSGRLSALPPDVLPLRRDHPLLIKFRIEQGALDQLKLAFVSDRDNSSFIRKVYVMNADGTNVTQLTQVGKESEPAWSPDGTKIAFTRNVGTFYFLPNILVMNADGSGQAVLTSHTGRRPRWSPDGSKIAFLGAAVGDNQLYLINADGSGLTNLTHTPGFHDHHAWSPDGSRIAFIRGLESIVGGQRSIDYNIFVINIDGSGETRLTDDPQDDFSPVWAPDGSKLAFSRSFAGGSAPPTGNIWIMNPDGSVQVNLTRFTEEGVSGGGPVWSPSGDRIAFTSGGPVSLTDILVVNANGSGVRNLTNTTALSEFGPAWSPDGSKIAFGETVNNAFDISVMNPDGTGRTNLTNNTADDVDWAWKP
jgi:Tol biopolymer transport system component